MNVLEHLTEGAERLKKAGCDTPQLDAEVLLAHVLSCERHDLYTTTTRYQVPHGKLELFKSFIGRRLKREPVAYIIGYKEFWSLKIKVTPAVLIPRPETEAVVEKALRLLEHRTSHIAHRTIQILDLCTGSGCIAAALAKELSQACITVTDISNEALNVARENLKFAEGRTTFLQSNLFEKVQGKFDLIVSNPPYVKTSEMEKLAPEITQYEPRRALDGGQDGLDFIRKIRQDVPRFLKPNGLLILENGPKIEIWKNSSSKVERHSTALSQ